MADDLRRRFGHLVAAHRRRNGMTQQRLAEAAGISSDMITRIEGGSTGARFPNIQRIADALGVDPAELFSPDLPKGSRHRAKFRNVTSRLSKLTDPELDWLDAILDAMLRPRP